MRRYKGEDYYDFLHRKYARKRERKAKRRKRIKATGNAVRNAFVDMYWRVRDYVYEGEHLYSKDTCKKWHCIFFMTILTPIKIVHMFANFLYKSRFIEAVFLLSGVAATVYPLYKLLYPFGEKWQTMLALAYGIVGLATELMLLAKVWKFICKFLLGITSYGNIYYNGYRERIRHDTGNYSMGLEEEARVGIGYFIRKNKKDKELIYIRD